MSGRTALDPTILIFLKGDLFLQAVQYIPLKDFTYEQCTRYVSEVAKISWFHFLRYNGYVFPLPVQGPNIGLDYSILDSRQWPSEVGCASINQFREDVARNHGVSFLGITKQLLYLSRGKERQLPMIRSRDLLGAQWLKFRTYTVEERGGFIFYFFLSIVRSQIFNVELLWPICTFKSLYVPEEICTRSRPEDFFPLTLQEILSTFGQVVL